MPTKVEKDAITGTMTTGHEWDGIKELDTPLPKWWLYVFYATIAFSALWVVLYPAVPFVNSHTTGILGQTNRDDLAKALATPDPRQAEYRARIETASLDEIRSDASLLAFAMAGGKAAFNENCVACHRAGGAGAKGYPNLADDDWLWGGSLETIHQTVQHGIRNPDPDSRQSEMPKFGEGMLTAAQIADVADYVLSLNGETPSAEAVMRGKAVFAENCVACHGENAEGNRELGAPKLKNHIFVYGGDRATLVQTITGGRGGSMPSWKDRLDPATIKMLAVYVHQLGGGE
ncbi:MAG: cytochrome-c oxidase, cbb3-type subunit III [Rhodospirillales bacterium]|nr:cytochrome-c oxidase, cbb3-type subunit III [Rhodospirillales bacterium]